MAAMGLNTEEQGSAMAFFRRGYKVGHCGCARCIRTRTEDQLYCCSV